MLIEPAGGMAGWISEEWWIISQWRRDGVTATCQRLAPRPDARLWCRTWARDSVTRIEPPSRACECRNLLFNTPTGRSKKFINKIKSCARFLGMAVAQHLQQHLAALQSYGILHTRGTQISAGCSWVSRSGCYPYHEDWKTCYRWMFWTSNDMLPGLWLRSRSTASHLQAAIRIRGSRRILR